jgi:hypothetical protein
MKAKFAIFGYFFENDVNKSKAKKKICGFPVSRPYLAFGRRNPDPKLFYWIMLVSVPLRGKRLWKIEI